jgi:hypothetical protein
MKKAVLFLAVALMVSVVCNYRQCTNDATTADTITIERTDTVDTTMVDTMPVVKYERVTEYVTIPCPGDTADTAVVLSAVQRTFTDDSTYTAYVSGVQYDRYPTLDSIAVQQRTIYKDVERTITVERRRPLSVGVQVGAGVGIISRQPDIFVGIGISYSF